MQAAMEKSQSSPSSNLDYAGNSTTTIPHDLIFEILSRLPAKPLLRFQAVAKLWFSIIHSKDFVDSFLVRSRTRPRLLFTFKHFDSRKRFIFSAPEHDNEEKSNDKSSTVVARHDMTISGFRYYIRTRPVNGFVCCIRGSSIAFCNPTTGQLVKLPDVKSNGRVVYARLGYDPVEDQYKVLCVMMFDTFDGNRKDKEQEHVVFTLRSQQQEWRKIDITGDSYRDVEGGICIDGAIYYGVGHTTIARFDVRSEKLEFIHTPTDEEDSINVYHWTLINHQGKLGGIDYDNFYHMRLWIQEKEECWNHMTCDVPCEWGDSLRDDKRPYTYSPGEIHTGEVILVSYKVESSKSFYVIYYDPIKESFRSAQVEGIADHEFRRIYGIGKRAREILCFPGHIENIMFL